MEGKQKLKSWLNCLKKLDDAYRKWFRRVLVRKIVVSPTIRRKILVQNLTVVLRKRINSVSWKPKSLDLVLEKKSVTSCTKSTHETREIQNFWSRWKRKGCLSSVYVSMNL